MTKGVTELGTINKQGVRIQISPWNIRTAAWRRSMTGYSRFQFRVCMGYTAPTVTDLATHSGNRISATVRRPKKEHSLGIHATYHVFKDTHFYRSEEQMGLSWHSLYRILCIAICSLFNPLTVFRYQYVFESTDLVYFCAIFRISV